jgi:hypothetical protein
MVIYKRENRQKPTKSKKSGEVKQNGKKELERAQISKKSLETI